MKELNNLWGIANSLNFARLKEACLGQIARRCDYVFSDGDFLSRVEGADLVEIFSSQHLKAMKVENRLMAITAWVDSASSRTQRRTRMAQLESVLTGRILRGLNAEFLAEFLKSDNGITRSPKAKYVFLWLRMLIK